MDQSRMPRSKKRTYSHYCQDAVTLLGGMIRVERKKRKLTAQEIADRAGTSRGLIQRIEKGDLKCEIGVVFEVATILGIKLFDADETEMKKHHLQIEEKLTLLPKSSRRKAKPVRDEF